MSTSSLIDALLFEPFTFQKSLMDSFICEPDAYEVWVVPGNELSGSGTACDPFVVDDSHFDSLMSGLQPHTTVHLGAGNFNTAGNWVLKAGQKIRGAGRSVTIIKRTPLVSDNLNYVIDGGTSSFLSGVEVSDVTLDCGMDTGSSNVAACALRVYGANVLLERLHIKNFGNKWNTTVHAVIAVAGASASWDASNCVVDGCRFDECKAAAGQPLTCIQLTCLTTGYFHRDCIVRNCFIKGPLLTINDTFPVRGISPGGGTGTVVEGNHLVNVYAGVYWDGTTYQTKDLIVRDNQIASEGDTNFVTFGIGIGAPTLNVQAVGRLLVEDNCIKLKDSVASIGDATPRGLYLDASTVKPFGEIIVRGNIFEQTSSADGNQRVMAVDLREATNLIVENNIVKLGAAHPLIHSDCGTKHFFSNRKPDGTLVQGFASTDANNGTKDDELESEVEDNLVIALT